MSDLRRCPDCGLAEERKVDKRGHALVNLDPTTGRCLRCTVTAAFNARPRLLEDAARLTSVPFDARAAAARNEE